MQCKVDQLGLDTELDDKVTTTILEAEWMQEVWRAIRKVSPLLLVIEEELPTQELAMDMEEVKYVYGGTCHQGMSDILRCPVSYIIRHEGEYGVFLLILTLV